MSNLLDVIRKNIEFVGISLLLMVIVFVIARASDTTAIFLVFLM